MILIKHLWFLFIIFFLKIKSNCDKENILILNTYSFQKKMLSNITCVLIYSLAKCVLEDVSENFVKLGAIYP